MADPHPKEPCGTTPGEGLSAHPEAGPQDNPGAGAGLPPDPPSSVDSPASDICPEPEPQATPGGGPPTPGSPARPAVTGRRSSPPWALRLRRAHGALAPWVLAPLLLTVSTGLSYRLLRDWGGLGRDQAHGLMVLHEGEWLRQWFGPTGETLYVLANGLGLLWMLASGGAMLWERRRRQVDPDKG